MIDLKKEKEASKDILRKVVGKISRGEPLVNVRKAAAIEERSNRGRPREDAGRDKGKGKGKRPLPRAGGQGGPPAKKARK